MNKFLSNKFNLVFITLFVIVSLLVLLPEFFQSGFIFSRNIVFTPVMFPSETFNFLNLFEYFLYFLSRILPAQILERLLLLLSLTGAQLGAFLLASRISKRPFLSAIIAIAYITTPITFSLLVNFSLNFLIIFALTPTFVHLGLDLLEDEYKEEELYKIFVLLIIGFFISPESTVLWGVTLGGLLSAKLILERKMETRVVGYTAFIIAACYVMVSFLQTFTDFRTLSIATQKDYLTGNFPFNLITIIFTLIILFSTFLSARNFILKKEVSKIGVISIIASGVLLGISFISNVGFGRFFPPISLLYAETLSFTLWILLLVGSLKGMDPLFTKVSSLKNLKLKKELLFISIILIILSPVIVFKSELLVSTEYPKIYEKVNEIIEPQDKILILSDSDYIEPDWLDFKIIDPTFSYFKTGTVRNSSSNECPITFKSDTHYGDASEYDVCFNYEDKAPIFKTTLENLQIKYIFVYKEFYLKAESLLKSDIYTIIEEDENALILKVY